MGKVAYARKITLSRDVAQYLIYSVDKGSVQVLYSRTYVLGQSSHPPVDRHYAGYRQYLIAQGWTITEEPEMGWTRGTQS